MGNIFTRYEDDFMIHSNFNSFNEYYNNNSEYIEYDPLNNHINDDNYSFYLDEKCYYFCNVCEYFT